MASQATTPAEIPDHGEGEGNLQQRDDLQKHGAKFDDHLVDDQRVHGR